MAAITAITGFQNLPNLTRIILDSSGNGAETVDVSGLTNLTYLDVSDMDIVGSEGVSSLTSINVSGCTALDELYADDSNFASGLPDLTGLNSLRIIDFDQCGLTGSIDLSTISSLESIDLSGNLGITAVNLPEANITNLDLEDTALTEEAVNGILQWLDSSGVEAGTVDLSGGTSAWPTGLGEDARQSLLDKDWEVDVNEAPPAYVGIAASTDFDIVGDFTIEMFINMDNVDGYPRPYSFGTYPAPNAISLEAGTMYFWANEDSLLAGNFEPTIGSWNHIAIMGSGSNVYMFADGEQIATNGYSPAAISSQGLPLSIGYGNEPMSGFNGKMSNFRWTNAALYPPEGFTVPTAPLTSSVDTVLLTFQGTTLNDLLLDNSGNDHNATNAGATYSASNPFIGMTGSLQVGAF